MGCDVKMYSWIICGILFIICIFLLFKVEQKQVIDNADERIYEDKIRSLQLHEKELQERVRAQAATIEEYNNKIQEAQDNYYKEMNKKISDLDNFFASQKEMRQSEMDTEFEQKERERTEALDLKIQSFAREAQLQINQIEENTKTEIERFQNAQRQIANETSYQEERYESLLEPLRKYEIEQQERLYYTIQVPDEYKEDISFLLNTVSQKVQHPDIINKLVWAEYVKPYLDDTFKRIEIKAEPGIYKLTNIDSGKSYIGKSTNVKKRISDHIKSSIGITSIADQAVHHEILKTGFWNWTIEIITYCDKEQLSELEKYYIEFFKTVTYGYNIRGGG